MYYITKKDSDTGKKFAEVYAKIEKASDETRALAKELGAKKFCTARWEVSGGLEAVILPSGTDNKALRLNKKFGFDNAYVPNLKTKEGRELKEKIANLFTVSKNELNDVVGYDDGYFSNIGYNIKNPDYYAFMIKEEWKLKMPSDCEEITTTKFNEMFKTE